MKRAILIAVLVIAFALPATAYAESSRRHEVIQPQEQQQQAEQVQTINAYDGVYQFGGRTETYYSSNVLRHYRIDEWTVDEDGFYRTDEGYYVVAASDYEQGAIIQTSMGAAQVLDCGCDAGITDFYVNWI